MAWPLAYTEWDQAIAGLSTVLSVNEPEAAWEWAMEIERPETREDVIKQIAQEWASKSPEAAREKLKEAGLDPALIAPEEGGVQ